MADFPKNISYGSIFVFIITFFAEHHMDEPSCSNSPVDLPEVISYTCNFVA